MSSNKAYFSTKNLAQNTKAKIGTIDKKDSILISHWFATKEPIPMKG